MNNNEFENYYQILGLPDLASIEEVKKAFRELAKKHHPDRGGDPEKFKKILEAYKVLSNPEEKERYDEILWFYTEDANIYNSAKEQKSGENFSSTTFIWQSNKTKTPTLLEGVLNFLINISPGILNIVKTLFNAIFSFNFSSLLLGILGLLLGFYIFYYILFLPVIIYEIISDYSLSFLEKITKTILSITLGLFLLDIMITLFSNFPNFLENKEFQIPYRDLNSFKVVYREHLFGLSMFCLVLLFLGYFMIMPYYKNTSITENLNFKEKQKSLENQLLKRNFITSKELFVFGQNAKAIILNPESKIYCSPTSYFYTKQPYRPVPNTKAIIFYQIKNPLGTWFRVAIDKFPLSGNFYYSEFCESFIEEPSGYQFWLKDDTISEDIQSQVLDIQQFAKDSLGVQSFYIDELYMKEKIRKCTNWDCEIKWLLGKEAIATVIEKKCDWFRVVISNFDPEHIDQFGEEGWVYKDFIPKNIRDNFEYTYKNNNFYR
jgi:hypothetical protein